MFSSKDVKNTKVYLEHFHQHLLDHNVISRITRLLQSRKSDHREAERIDRCITDAGIVGENACRRRRMRFHWFIDLHKTKREYTMLCTLQSWKRRNLPLQCIIERVKSIFIDITEDVTIVTIEHYIQRLRASLKQIHSKAAELREETLTNLANFSADISDNQKAKYIRQKKRQEQKVRVYNLLKYQRQKRYKKWRNQQTRSSVRMANNVRI